MALRRAAVARTALLGPAPASDESYGTHEPLGPWALLEPRESPLRLSIAGHDLTRETVRSGLAAIRDDLGFETATLFGWSSSGWRLLLRDGPEHDWHVVLEPSLLEGTPEVAEYPNVRTIPGIGTRLARMGCESLASLPLPDDERLLLDSSWPGTTGGWVQHARTYLELASILTKPEWAAGAAARSRPETDLVQQAFDACERAAVRPDAGVQDLLHDLREALEADELFLVSDAGDGMAAFSAKGGVGPRLSPALETDLRAAKTEIEGELLERLGAALGASSGLLLASAGSGERSLQVVIAGWRRSTGLSAESVAVVAGALFVTLAAMRGRKAAVKALTRSDRMRIAYALHDDLTQTVAGAVLELEALQRRIERDPNEAISTLETSKAEIRRSLRDIRAMLFGLSAEEHRPSRMPLTSYIEDVVARWNLAARVVVEGDLSVIPGRVLAVAYVVIREALANAAKHASSSGVTVRIVASESELVVTVGDSGPGFTALRRREARAAHHLGLDMVRRQVREAGGRLRVESRPGSGTRVVAHLPLEPVS